MKRRAAGITRALTPIFALLLLAVGVAALPGTVGAQDADKLARDIQRNLGRVDMQIVTSPAKAEEKLIELHGQFQELKAAAPEHKSVPSLQRKFDTTAEKLSKRLKRPVAFGEATAPAEQKPPAPAAAAEEAPAKKSAASSGDKLPGSVRFKMEQLEKELADGEKQVEAGKADRAERNVTNAGKKLGEILDKVENEDHPRIQSAIERYEALKEQVAQAKASIMPRYVQGELSTAEERSKMARQMLDAPVESRADSEERHLEKIAKEIEIAEGRLDGAMSESDKLGYDYSANPRFAQARDQIEALKSDFDKRLARFQGHEQANQALADDAAKDFAELEQMDDIAEKYVNSLTLQDNNLLSGDNNSAAKERLAGFEEFASKHRATIEEKIVAVRDKYGADRIAIDNNLRAAGYDGSSEAGHVYDRLDTKLKKASEFRLIAADILADSALKAVDWIENVAHDFAFQEGEARALDAAEVARGFAAGEPKITGMLKDLQGQIDTAVAMRWKRIDERTWPGHGAGAPEDRDELAAVAFKWVADSPDWGSRQGNNEYKDQEPRKPVKVAVIREWYVTETDNLGQPIQYGLPVLIGVELEREKADNLARAYELTLLGPKRKDPPQSPPFGDAWVGDSYYIRRDKLN